MPAEKTKKTNVCSICHLSNTASQVVVSRGNPLARLMIIGEAPGAKEDALGAPFVGRSGKLLDFLLEEVGINSKKAVFVCNAIKCRPPNNRRPSQKELSYSLPWLHQQIELVDPWIIILAGSTAVQTLLGVKEPITTLRGNWHHWEGRSTMPIFHPAFLLRNPTKLKGGPTSLTKGDLLKVKNRLDKITTAQSMQELIVDIGCKS